MIRAERPLWRSRGERSTKRNNPGRSFQPGLHCATRGTCSVSGAAVRSSDKAAALLPSSRLPANHATEESRSHLHSSKSTCRTGHLARGDGRRRRCEGRSCGRVSPAGRSGKSGRDFMFLSGIFGWWRSRGEGLLLAGVFFGSLRVVIQTVEDHAQHAADLADGDQQGGADPDGKPAGD